MKKFLTAKETEGMTLEQFQAAMREGRVEVRRESMDNVTADMVTMNGRFGCEWVFFDCVWFVYDLHFRICVYVRSYVSCLYAFALGLIMASVFAVTGCVDSDVLDEFDFQSEYLEWEDIACMSEIQQEDDDDDDLSIDIFPNFSE